MGQLTTNTPKPLLEVAGKPILHYIIMNLAKNGYEEIGINLHHHPEKIKSVFGDGSQHHVKLHYIVEDELSGTAGAIKKFQSFLKDDPFLVHYGDILTDHPLINLGSSQKDFVGTLLLHKNPHSNSFVSLDEKRSIIEFIERPSIKPQGEYFTNSGVYFFTHDIHRYLNDFDNQVIDFPKDIFPLLVKEGQLKGVLLDGQRVAIDSPERLELANSTIENFNF